MGKLVRKLGAIIAVGVPYHRSYELNGMWDPVITREKNVEGKHTALCFNHSMGIKM
jgi:hypothetical protein